MHDVTVAINQNSCPAKATAIDNAGVIVSVAEHSIARANEGGDGSRVGRIACGKENRRFGLLEFGEQKLQPLVSFRSTGYERAGPGAEVVHVKRISGGLNQCRIIGQPQIII